MSEPPKVRAHIWVKGRVQGVGFRAWVADNAEALGVTGWVRNVGWDTVETVAEGAPDEVEKFTQLVLEGPSVARVREHRVEAEPPSGEFPNFEVRYSR